MVTSFYRFNDGQCLIRYSDNSTLEIYASETDELAFKITESGEYLNLSKGDEEYVTLVKQLLKYEIVTPDIYDGVEENAGSEENSDDESSEE